jgi:predicted nuclease of predicted toxin-antitoxin system
MPLLLDGNISKRLKTLLSSYQGEIVSIFDLGFDELEDIRIWAYAKDNGYDILTKDADFLDIATCLGPPPKVIFLPVGNCPSRHIVDLFNKYHREIAAHLENDEVSIIILDK